MYKPKSVKNTNIKMSTAYSLGLFEFYQLKKRGGT